LSIKKPQYSKRAVTSKDGATIGFRQLGHGPGLVILHGGPLASQHYMNLGAALADEFSI
jgi:pimeloyl-ACP methyl ester carboxylesterase